MSIKVATQVVLDAVRRFPNLPDRTLARHLIMTHSLLFDNDIEKARDRVRYFRGRKGEKNKDVVQKAHPLLLKDHKILIPKSLSKKRTNYLLKSGTWLVLSDLHIPCHEIAPIEAAIQNGKAEGIDGIFINGDLQDCTSLSYWPTLKRDFNSEIEAVIDFFDYLKQEFPGIPIVYKPANHELRLQSHYIAYSPELATSPLAAMETLFDFESRGVEYLDYYQLVMAGKLPILHGHELRNISRAVNPARGLYLRTKTFSACSHCHTTSEHTSKNVHGEILTCWSFGCLCDLEPDWNPYGNDWNWGFGIVNVEKDGNFEVINRRILPNGKVV